MIANSIDDLVGDTPLIRLNRLSKLSGATILAKCEFLNPTSSIKDRIALNMIQKAIDDGSITKGTTVIEPTSGNTGIGLASICASKGIKLILTMPESMSIERRKILTHLGAKLVLTPASEGMNGSIAEANRLQSTMDNAIVLQQFQNPNNPDAHRHTTALEILKDSDGDIAVFVSTVGTGGTLTGVSEVLKEQIPNLKAVAVEPKESAILSGGTHSPHKIEGIGAGFIPPILNTSIYDEVISVTNEEAIGMARDLAKDEGLLVGISSGANIEATYRVACRPENRGRVIVTILCDTAQRYLSTELFE